MMSFTFSCADVATLQNFVVHVVLRCSKEKMLRINATWVITTMADHKPFRDWAVEKLERDAVGKQRYPERYEFRVPTFVFRISGFPAAAFSVYLITAVESLNDPAKVRHLRRLFKFFESNASNVFAFALVLSKSVQQFPCVFIAMLKPIAIIFRVGVVREFGEDFVRIH